MINEELFATIRHFLSDMTTWASPSFMRKGKKVCWNLVKENPEFLTAFSEIGLEMRASESLLHSLERFVCRLYGEKRLTSVNEVRKKIFWKNYSRETE